MNKAEIQAYFDRHAKSWDENMIRSQKKIDIILDAAGVDAESTVLDVACGTGVLFEDYLLRGVKKLVGVDISMEMTNIARRKYPQSHVSVICADIEEADIGMQFDCCVVYNAIPHFPDPQSLIQKLASMTRPKGRLCIAHGMSREAIMKHHSKGAKHVSRPLPEAGEMSKMMEQFFAVDTMISDHEKYIVAGSRR